MARTSVAHGCSRSRSQSVCCVAYLFLADACEGNSRLCAFRVERKPDLCRNIKHSSAPVSGGFLVVLKGGLVTGFLVSSLPPAKEEEIFTALFCFRNGNWLFGTLPSCGPPVHK